MKSEEEIRDMARQIYEQAQKTKDSNPTANSRLNSRLYALAWVLDFDKPHKIETLIFDEEYLELMKCLF